MKAETDRRQFLKVTGTAIAGAALASCDRSAGTQEAVLRIAHFTDVHFDGSDESKAGFRACLTAIARLEPRPDLVFNTGDSIMDSLGATKREAERQWMGFTEVLGEYAFPGAEVHHLLGNHDVWGWGLPPGVSREELELTDPQFGKRLAMEVLQLSDPAYFAFEKNGWRFIALDSTSPADPDPAVNLGIPYVGRLDDAQFAWLEDRLLYDGPICILSHVPFVAGCEIFDGENETSGNWIIPGAWVHIDARRLRNALLARSGPFPHDRHPPVLCLSGHTHQREVLDHLGVRYMTNGSVCGDWWGSARHYLDTPRGFAVVDLHADGSSKGEYRPLR